MKIFNIALIGFGGFGQFLYNSWSNLKNVRIIAIADQDVSRLGSLDTVAVYQDWRSLLTLPDIDLVAIVTPPHTHQGIATACMRAGKHILIEKPLALNISDARSILETRDHTGRIAAIDFIMRFNPMLKEIRRLTRDGTFGEIRRVDVENYAQDEQLPDEHWFWKTEQSGGILIEHGVHFMDLVHYLSPSDAIRVTGMKNDRKAGQEDQVMANILYKGGLIATHYHSFARPGFFEQTRITLSFDLADITLHGWIPLHGDIRVLVNPETRHQLENCPFFYMDAATPLDKVSDDSRPEGWGMAENNEPGQKRLIKSGGITYEVTEMINGRLDTRKSKHQLYQDCVRESLSDVLLSIANPEHQLTAPLEAGIKSLDIAIKATNFARMAEKQIT